MTFEQFVADLADRMMQKSGVQEWTDPEWQTNVMQAAINMAAMLYYPEGSAMANELYLDHGTEVVFGSEVGDDVAWSSENISNGAGRQSSLYDQGADGTARPWIWRYRIYTQAQATPTVGNVLEMYLKTSDGTHPDNDDGTSDAAVSAENKLKNLSPLRSPVVDEAAANIEYVSRGQVRVPERYFGVALWNNMGSAVTNDAAETKAVFTQVYSQQQA